MKRLLAATLAAALLAAPAIAQDLFTQDSLISLDAPMDSTVISAQWVKPDASGTITGQVMIPGSSAGDLTGDLFLAPQQGEPTRVPVSPSGEFMLTGVAPGVYTLVYQSPTAFGAYALQVVAGSNAANLANKTVVAAAAIAPQMALTTVARYQPTTEPMSAEISGVRTPSGNGAFAPGGEPMNLAKVAQTAAGGMQGRIIRAGSAANGLMPATDMNVLVMQQGQLVDKTVTDADGNFVFDNLASGSYELVASGASGFAVIGFELVSSPEVLTSTAVAPATLQPGVASVLVVQAANPDPSLLGPGPFGPNPSDDPLNQPVPLGADPLMNGPLAGGPGSGGISGGGGGGFGGGGGGMGGGGLGGLAAIGAVLAATLVGDDDNDNFVPAPSSPAIP